SSSYCGHSLYPVLTSFPTRRSSDLGVHLQVAVAGVGLAGAMLHGQQAVALDGHVQRPPGEAQRAGGQVDAVVLDARHVPAEAYTDRKSTRLNSSHVKTSYAVFCLKK